MKFVERSMLFLYLLSAPQAGASGPGDLDATFGTAGRVMNPIGSVQGMDVAVQKDGKIVVAGYIWRAAGLPNFVVIRYNPDGLLDDSFNGTGIVADSPTEYEEYATSLAFQTDGKIVVAGSSRRPDVH